MFLERSVQRILVGASTPVSSNLRLVVMPASLTVLSNTVPTPTGPSVVWRISCTRGLNLGSLVPSARNANTSSMGRSMTAEPLNSCAMDSSLVGNVVWGHPTDGARRARAFAPLRARG